MDRVFPALVTRFNRDSELRKIGRKLFLGSPEETRTPRNYVEVECNGVNNDFDTFGTDEPVYDLTFTVYSHEKDDGRKCSRIVRALLRVFNNAKLLGSGFETSGFVMSAGPGPTLTDGVYQGVANGVLHITLNQQQPADQFVA